MLQKNKVCRGFIIAREPALERQYKFMHSNTTTIRIHWLKCHLYNIQERLNQEHVVLGEWKIYSFSQLSKRKWCHHNNKNTYRLENRDS